MASLAMTFYFYFFGTGIGCMMVFHISLVSWESQIASYTVQPRHTNMKKDNPKRLWMILVHGDFKLKSVRTDSNSLRWNLPFNIIMYEIQVDLFVYLFPKSNGRDKIIKT
jgi:hypothetical protein